MPFPKLAPAFGPILLELAEIMRPTPADRVSTYCEANRILGEDYPTDHPGEYSLDGTPWIREMLDNFTDPSIDRQVTWKGSQTGLSESAISLVNYIKDVDPRHILFALADKATAAELHERLELSMEGTVNYISSRNQKIKFRRGSINVIHASGKQSFKSKSASVLIGDEVASWPPGAVEQFEKRATTARNLFFWLFSAQDFVPSRERKKYKRRAFEDSSDFECPLKSRYEKGDKREWTIPDPRAGKGDVPADATFFFSFSALQWSPRAKRADGSWDYAQVRRTAHLRTPAGTKINAARWAKLVCGPKARWVATNPNGDYPSYRVPSALCPWPSTTLGEIAVRYLRAKGKGRASVRTFYYEDLAEDFTEYQSSSLKGSLLSNSQNDFPGYRKGIGLYDVPAMREHLGDRRPYNLMTADVQQDHIWYVIRQHVPGSNGLDSALIDYGIVYSFAELNQICADYDIYAGAVDINYDRRRMETLEACFNFGWIGMRGANTPMTMGQYVANDINPFEGDRQGRARLGHVMRTYRWDTNAYKDRLHALIAREQSDGAQLPDWFVWHNIENTYQVQMQAEKRINGVWVKIKNNNHLWDCETNQLCLSDIHRATA